MVCISGLTPKMLIIRFMLQASTCKLIYRRRPSIFSLRRTVLAVPAHDRSGCPVRSACRCRCANCRRVQNRRRVSIGRGRLQESNQLGAVLGRREPTIRLHVVTGDNLIGFRDEAVELFLVPDEVRALHSTGIAEVR